MLFISLNIKRMQVLEISIVERDGLSGTGMCILDAGPA